MKFKNPVFIIILSFFPLFNLFSEPLDIRENWFVKEGRFSENRLDFERQISDSNNSKPEDLGWTHLKSLPFQHLREDERSGKVRVYSLVKKIQMDSSVLDYPNRSLSIFLPEAGNQVEIYWNGILIYQIGSLDKNGEFEYGFQRNIIAEIPSASIREGENLLVIQVAGYDYDSFYILPFHENTPARIAIHNDNLLENTEYVTLMLLFLYLFVGLYHLLLFVKRREEIYNLYFGLFSTCLALYIYSRTDNSYQLLDYSLSFMHLRWFELIILFQAGPLLILFFETFLTGKERKVTIAYLIFVQFLALAIPFSSYYVQGNIILRTWHICVLFSVFYIIYLFTRSVTRKVPDAKRLLAGIAVMMVTVVLDILGAASVLPQNLGLTKYGFFVFIIGIAVVLANRFLRVHKEVEELNRTLEEKVEARTKELSDSLDKVQLLKEQQDGDYFLTSLLLKPLNSNESKSKHINIDFYIHQKKQFEFRKKNLEIGGDICMTSQLKLLGRSYTVFVNGDAMGKSIQGAGGALVLGVVFKSILNRTKIFTENQNKYPEVWLKECFIELHNVFESFNGSMLISVVMGLIDDETGMMYFLNAEHPWCVLYRDESASFIEDDLYMRKIGMMDMHGAFQVRTFPLLPGDKILIGSDGRDDLQIGTDEEGGRIINEDERLFLDRVRDGKGDIQGIVKSISNFGELTDDLSLMSIEYVEESLSSRDDSKSVMWKKLSRDNFRTKNYAKAAEYGEKYLEENPFDNQYIYVTAYCYKIAKNYTKAIQLSERLRLREPFHIKNLINLSDIYRLMGEKNRAGKFLEKIISIDPNNSMIQKLRVLLNKTATISNP
ncbi:SpoIIE family protein phosphatase [Leptospira sp. GIMC2001]|uniref:SpoIIE family protein phosphatase n=1 Tax=Leptospira sp. GIMC2001 TaxID=1513297 RepID=UPI002349C63E|nr:SpoIIE family protein phosphatase [Leptospira sp. GIMC2001]WCL48623.1 SpoIIE family protein phosphatase [Leptospira sp. GIMC2001]